MDSRTSMSLDLLGRFNACANFNKATLSMNILDIIGYPANLRGPALGRITVKSKGNGRAGVVDHGLVAAWLVVGQLRFI